MDCSISQNSPKIRCWSNKRRSKTFVAVPTSYNCKEQIEFPLKQKKNNGNLKYQITDTILQRDPKIYIQDDKSYSCKRTFAGSKHSKIRIQKNTMIGLSNDDKLKPTKKILWTRETDTILQTHEQPDLPLSECYRPKYHTTENVINAQNKTLSKKEFSRSVHESPQKRHVKHKKSKIEIFKQLKQQKPPKMVRSSSFKNIMNRDI